MIFILKKINFETAKMFSYRLSSIEIQATKMIKRYANISFKKEHTHPPTQEMKEEKRKVPFSHLEVTSV